MNGEPLPVSDRTALIVGAVLVLVLVFLAGSIVFARPVGAEIVPGLPDLVVQRPRGLDVVGPDDGRRLLYFDSTLTNSGGNFEVRGVRPDSTVPLSVFQRVHNPDGSTTDVPLPNAQMVYETHVPDNVGGVWHWHLVDLYTVTLVNRVGAAVGGNAKYGFCFYDSEHHGYGGAGRTYGEGGCGPGSQFGGGWSSLCAPTYNLQCGPNALRVGPMGLTPGWIDTYYGGVVNQWIDVTGIPPGHYTLRIEMNQALGLVDADHSNEVAEVGVNL